MVQNMPPGYSETKSKHLTGICMWAKNIFWAISERAFFWGNNLFQRT
jgi:hypothetical protein